MKFELKTIFRYIRRYGWYYLFGIGSLLMVDLLLVVIPRLTGQITDGLDMGTMDLGGIRSIIFRILLFGGCIALGRFGWRFFLFGAARSIERDLRNDLFEHLETLSLRYFHEHKTGDLMAHFTSDIGAVRQLVGMTIITTFDASVMLILVLTNMIRFVSLKLTLVAVIPMVVIVIGDMFFGKAMHRRFLQKQEAFSMLTDQVQESVSGIRVIKAFVQERKELQAFAAANGVNREKNMRVVRLVSLAMPLLDLVVGISSLLTLLYGGYLAIAGEITVGQFVAFNSYIGMLVWPMIAVGECISSISQGMASLRRVCLILQEKPDIQETESARDYSDGHLKGGLLLRDVTFTYPGATHPALSHVSLEIQPGETVAIIGRTGSGKTTLVSLIERLYDTPLSDMILLDGHSVQDLPLALLRGDIAYVPQDQFLFSDTIERNIAFGDADVSHERVAEMAKAACVHNDIMRFPEGYQTMLGERGVTVSGGQKQRIAIARALIKDAPVLILDDALSAVDTDTEEKILSSIRTLRKNKTTIIIAHRISTIQHADHILVLEEGTRAEYGTHAELMDLHGIYRQLHDRQQLEMQLNQEETAGGDRA